MKCNVNLMIPKDTALINNIYIYIHIHRLSVIVASFAHVRMQKYTFSVGGHTMAPTRAYLRIPVDQANLAKRNSHFIEILRFIRLHNSFAFSRYREDKEGKRGKRKEKKKKKNA